MKTYHVTLVAGEARASFTINAEKRDRVHLVALDVLDAMGIDDTRRRYLEAGGMPFDITIKETRT